MTMYHTISAPGTYRRIWENLVKDRSNKIMKKSPKIIIDMMKRDYPNQEGTPKGLCLCPKTFDMVLFWKH